VTLAYLKGHGVDQARRYVDLLNAAARRRDLDGWYNSPNQGQLYYNWNTVEFYLGHGDDWPGKLRTPLLLPGANGLELVADYAKPGLVVYWLEIDPTFVPPRNVNEIPARYKRLLRNRNWNPVTQQVSQPNIDPVIFCATVVVIGGTVFILLDPVPGDEILIPIIWGPVAVRVAVP
jgi:hypothetical protein